MYKPREWHHSGLSRTDVRWEEGWWLLLILERTIKIVLKFAGNFLKYSVLTTQVQPPSFKRTPGFRSFQEKPSESAKFSLSSAFIPVRSNPKNCELIK